MPDLPSSSSFIPKRATGTKIRQKRTRNFFLLSIVSYACLIAAPTASAAVYVYELYTQRQFDQAVQKLEEAIGSFSEAEMARVLEFDRRLKESTELVDSHVSLVKALDILEANTARDVSFVSLSMKQGDGIVTATGDVTAPSFDAALFQRATYLSQNVPIKNAALKDITFVPASDAGTSVTMKASFDFSADTISFTVSDTASASTTAPDQTEVTPMTESSDDTTTSTDTNSGETL